MSTCVPLRRLTAVAAASAAALTFALVPTASATPVSPDTLMAERTNPAVQLIQTRFDATVTMRPVDLNGDGWDLFDTAIRKYSVGELRSLSDIAEYVFERVEDNPMTYLREVGEPRTKRFSETYRGSGFIASPDGYVVTARHVVTADSDVKKTFAQDGATGFVRSDLQSWNKAFRKWDLSQDARESLAGALSTFEAAKVKVKVSAPKISVVLGTASGDGSRVGKAYPAEVAYRSGAALGEDVAVIRMHGWEQMPSLALSPTAAVQGDRIYINGFPALPDGSEAALLQPTLTSGQITAIKPTESGIQTLQTDTTASPGSSGAAALNPAGQVIGILVSGARDGNGGSLGQNYLMPLDSVRNALARSGAVPAASRTTELYDKALDDFYADHNSRALEEFRQVKDLFPPHAYASGYISRAQSAIDRGVDVPVAQPRAEVPWLLVGLGVAVLLLGSGGTFLVLRRRPRSPRGGPGTDAPVLPVGSTPASAGAPAPAGPNGWVPQPPLTPVVAPALASTAVARPAMVEDLPADPTGEEPADDEDADAIPEWQPIDYVAAFPANDTPRPAV